MRTELHQAQMSLRQLRRTKLQENILMRVINDIEYKIDKSEKEMEMITGNNNSKDLKRRSEE